MTTVTPAIIDQYQTRLETAQNKNKNDLDQDAFLKLMTTQLKHQDPFKPMENGEFLGQMAQFSTVSGIEQMQESIESLASTYGSNQTLEASRLVGQEVLVESDSLSLDANGRAGARFELDAASGQVEVDITDASGSTVRTLKLGEHAAGRHDIDWDGLDDNARPVPPGDYRISVRARAGDEYVAAATMVTRVIESVEFGAGGESRLNTRQGDSLTLNDIREIRQAISSDDR